jgi:hypothetical protein
MVMVQFHQKKSSAFDVAVLSPPQGDSDGIRLVLQKGEHSCWPKNQSCCSWRPRDGVVPRANKRQAHGAGQSVLTVVYSVRVSEGECDGATTTMSTTTRSLTTSLRFFDAYLLHLLDSIILRLAVANVPVVLAAAIVRSPATVTKKDPRFFGRPREWPAWRRPMTDGAGRKFVRARDKSWRNEIGDPRSRQSSRTSKATVPPTLPLLPPSRRRPTQRQGEREE